MNLNKNKVVIGMSGGVDSSVAAALLIEQGYEVVGITITPFKINADCNLNNNPKGCCSINSAIDAHRVCSKLGIKHLLIDLTEVFKKQIVDYFVYEYINGRTPNPCVECNPKIKWNELLKKCDSLNAFYLATGHYAKISFENNQYILSKGFDTNKDQSYFLWKLSQEQLGRTLFPLANYNKLQIRQLAEHYGFEVFNKPDSQEVCFIPDNDYQNFIIKNAESYNFNIKKGDILFQDRIIGQHNGCISYTIGQRRGLGISYKQPLYVKQINTNDNTIIVGIEDDLFQSKLIASNVNIIKYSNLNTPKKFIVKIRYRDKGSEAWCFVDDNNKLHVEFLQKRKAITPGQSVVLYENDDIIGGAIIESTY